MKITAKWGKHSFSATLKHKVTIVIGESGNGKTTIANALRLHSTVMETTNNAEVVVLTQEIFERELKHLRRYIKLNHPDFDFQDQSSESTSLLRRYSIEIWSDPDFAPYSNSIIVVDDAHFIRCHDFALMFNCDKTNHYLFFLRDQLSNINYSIDAVKVLYEEDNHYSLKQALTYNK